MRVKITSMAAVSALLGFATAGPAKADGWSLKSGESEMCRESAANSNGCVRIRGYIAAGSDFAGEVRMGEQLFLRPSSPSPRGGAAPAPRLDSSGFDGRFLIDASHDASFR